VVPQAPVELADSEIFPAISNTVHEFRSLTAEHSFPADCHELQQDNTDIDIKYKCYSAQNSNTQHVIRCKQIHWTDDWAVSNNKCN